MFSLSEGGTSIASSIFITFTRSGGLAVTIRRLVGSYTIRLLPLGIRVLRMFAASEPLTYSRGIICVMKEESITIFTFLPVSIDLETCFAVSIGTILYRSPSFIAVRPFISSMV